MTADPRGAAGPSQADPIVPAGTSPTGSTARPLVSLLLLAYRQQSTVGAAIAGALAQTYEPLEILISDDASDDATFDAIEAAVRGYAGPHRVLPLRNPVNLGIGGHLNRLVERSHGELLFVAAGDDVSHDDRCERVVAAWLAADRRPDLIAAGLADLDADGRVHGTIAPTDLAGYRDAADWLARPPHVVGAAQAWTRRLWDRFGPLPAQTMGEDLILTFRAILAGGAITLPEVLVDYRRGGISRRRRATTAADVRLRLTKNNRHALVELPQLLADARLGGQLAAVDAALSARLAREVFVRDLFAATGLRNRLQLTAGTRSVPLPVRLRLLVYAAFPWLLAPGFALKRAVARQRD